MDLRPGDCTGALMGRSGMPTALSGIFGWVPLIGGLLLAAVVLWALFRNKKAPRAEVDESERGAKALREQLNAEDKAREGE